MLAQITPVILTLNEELNIARTLSRLTWAKDIVVVDSGSTDRTMSILSKFPYVRLFQRPFDTHANQWTYAVSQTRITTKWVLRLDADYQVTEGLMQELAQLDPDADVDAYRISFDYAVYGHRLSASLYPSNTVLLKPGRFTVVDRGHTEKWIVQGPVVELTSKILHDDWKPMDAWIVSQGKYMAKEVRQLEDANNSLVSWLRHHPPLMPILTFLYCLFGKGLILNGKAGMLYTFQRTVAEAILSLLILEKCLSIDKSEGSMDPKC